ncbi:serpin [Penaeus vannamei]|uniref:Serpin n=1 Tax=Penaeus vannamei TaxID=6689 RepID=A0A423U7L4_PENVA|nr:serpin [Penaeus vannamei]
MVLTNAVYFKGFWKYPFKPQRTHKDKFFVTPEESVQVDMMSQTRRFKYVDSEKLHAQVLEMPYRGDAVSMVVLLPKWESQGGGQAGPTPGAQGTRVRVEGDALRPADSQVSQTLQKMGIRDLFSSTADLTNITPVGGIMLNGAIHKALIEVDEEGAEAAAATAFFRSKSRPMPPKTTFTCNRPFVFFIQDNKVNNIMFIGVYRGP